MVNKSSKLLMLFGLFLLALSYPANVMAETAKQLYDKAIASGKAGGCQDAAKLLRKALDIEPHNMAITISLSFAVDCSKGNVAKDVAMDIFASTSAGNRGDWSTALSLAKKVCNVAPNYAPAFVHLGVVYVQMIMTNKGDPAAAEAIKAYSKAIEMDPGNGLAHYNVGVAYAAQHKWRLAKVHLSKASSLGIRDPDDLISYVQTKTASAEKKEKPKKKSSLWPFGPDGLICKHMYRSAYTDTEKKLWNAVGGGCRR